MIDWFKWNVAVDDNKDQLQFCTKLSRQVFVY